MKLVEFSTNRRVTVAMLMVAVVAFGLVGFSRLAVNLLPDITYPTITIRTEYAGTAPLEIERLISEPIEGLVGVVSSVVRVSSVSRPGLSDVIVEFAGQDGTPGLRIVADGWTLERADDWYRAFVRRVEARLVVLPRLCVLDVRLIRKGQGPPEDVRRLFS